MINEKLLNYHPEEIIILTQEGGGSDDAKFDNQGFELDGAEIDSKKNYEKIESSDFFDLNAFFDSNDSTESSGVTAGQDNLDEDEKNEADLLLTLLDESNESIATLTTKITAETFATGASLTSGVFSALGSIVGSCGIFCAHGLGSIAQVGSSGLGVAPGVGGLNMPGFSVDGNGNFHLDGNIDSLSRATGISKNDLLSGKFSAEDILTAFFSVFGEGISYIFGFGLIGGIIDAIFDNFPTTAAA